MTEFFSNLKTDLTDRRLLPLVALAALALVGALAYALLGGGSSSSTPASTPAVVPATPSGLAVSEVQSSSKQAVAETTSGAAGQRRGIARDPFVGLPGYKSATASAASSSKSSSSPTTESKGSSSSSSSSGSSGSKSSGSSSEGSSGGSKKSKPKPLYRVALLFGELPPGTLPANAQLKAYTGVTGQTPLPSQKQMVVRYLGTLVTSQGPRASFEVSGEAIIHGEGTCLPSTAQCKVINLAEGKTEQLQTILDTGQAVTWELRVVTIESASASGASVARVLRSQARAASSLEAEGGAMNQAGLHFTSRAGMLVLLAPVHATRAHGARAHTALAHAGR